MVQYTVKLQANVLGHVLSNQLKLQETSSFLKPATVAAAVPLPIFFCLFICLSCVSVFFQQVFWKSYRWIWTKLVEKISHGSRKNLVYFDVPSVDSDTGVFVWFLFPSHRVLKRETRFDRVWSVSDKNYNEM